MSSPADEPSLTQQLGQFVHELTYDQLPHEVVERSKSLLLHNLANALVGVQYPVPRRVLDFVKREEASNTAGSSLLVDGSAATKMGAAYANSLFMHVTGQSDSFGVFTHPGLTVIPAALALAESSDASGRELLTAVVAGYEVLARVAAPALAATQANGFRSGAVYGGLGAAVAAAKTMRLDARGIADAIANWVSVAAGNLEGARSGGHETVLHEPTAARNGVLAALQAADGFRGGSTVLEGDAGFYRSYARGAHVVACDSAGHSPVTHNLGSDWKILEVIQKAYSTSGYNQPVVELSHNLAREHGISATEIEQITLELNHLEVLYPSPEFTTSIPQPRRKGSQYFCAWGLTAGPYPRLGRPIGHMVGLDESDQTDPTETLELMQKVVLVASTERPLMSASVTVKSDRGFFAAAADGREFVWSFERTLERARELIPGMAVPADRFEVLAAEVDQLEESTSVDLMLALTSPESAR